MRDTEYYLEQAKFCAELAESVKRPDYKDRWLKTLGQNGSIELVQLPRVIKMAGQLLRTFRLQPGT